MFLEVCFVLALRYPLTKKREYHLFVALLNLVDSNMCISPCCYFTMFNDTDWFPAVSGFHAQL